MKSYTITSLKNSNNTLSLTHLNLKTFFSGLLIEKMAVPTTDVPEAAIDHFDRRHDPGAVQYIYRHALQYLQIHGYA